jgi:hypothetical protein
MKKSFEEWLELLIQILILSEYGKENSWKFRNEKLEIAKKLYKSKITPANAAARIVHPDFE